jgi:hypothetical protein
MTSPFASVRQCRCCGTASAGAASAVSSPIAATIGSSARFLIKPSLSDPGVRQSDRRIGALPGSRLPAVPPGTTEWRRKVRQGQSGPARVPSR